MNWGAVTLEVGLLALSVIVLGWDLIFAHGPGASRREKPLKRPPSSGPFTALARDPGGGAV